MKTSRSLVVLALLAAVAVGCAGAKNSGATGSGGGGGSSGGTGHGGSTGAGGAAATTGNGGGAGGGVQDCVNLQCQQTKCLTLSCTVPSCGETATPTTLSGTVYDPAGKIPLYNVVVYVPNEQPGPIMDGVTCDTCAGTTSGHPIASAITDAAGHFVLDNPPVGDNIPLVIQVGKWRRQVTIPHVDSCVDNPISDPNLLRLPRDQSEGHIPRIAITTGHSDALECLLRKIGIADSEFTTDAGTGRINMFVGGDPAQVSSSSPGGEGANQFVSGTAFPNASTLWGSVPKLLQYDIMVLSCEGSQFPAAKDPYLANIRQYADSGGRIFDDHLHFYWIYKGLPPWPSTAGWIGVGTDLGDITATVDTSFAKGNAFADWLMNVGASTTRTQIPIVMAQHSLNTDMPPVSQRWIYTSSPSVQYLTFNTPVEVPAGQQCGRVVFTDIHVSSASGDSSHPNLASPPDPPTPFPTGCTSTTLAPQEKALEFMFFDLSSCVQQDTAVPQPPIIVP
jgi:hypothetical protein